MVELIGYAASALVALSLLMVSLMKLRIVNLIGAILFTVYGVLIGAWPIVLSNGFIVCVNIFYLYRILLKDAGRFEYSLLQISEVDLVVRFLREKLDDCLSFHPLFHPKMISFAFGGSGKIYGAFRNNRLNGISVLLKMDRILEYRPKFWQEGGEEEHPSLAVAHRNEELLLLVEELSERFQSSSTYFMPVDYLVAKYRDLGVVARFHKRLLADLPQDVERIVCVARRSDQGTRRFYQRNGYEKVFSRSDLTAFELDLRDLRKV